MEFLLAIGAAWVQAFCDMPMKVGPGGDDVAIHGPVVILAEGEAVGGVVVAGLGKRDEVRGIDEGNIVASSEPNAQAACCTLMIVDVEDEPAKGRTATVFGGLFCDERERRGRFDHRSVVAP